MRPYVMGGLVRGSIGKESFQYSLENPFGVTPRFDADYFRISSGTGCMAQFLEEPFPNVDSSNISLAPALHTIRQ